MVKLAANSLQRKKVKLAATVQNGQVRSNFAAAKTVLAAKNGQASSNSKTNGQVRSNFTAARKGQVSSNFAAAKTVKLTTILLQR